MNKKKPMIILLLSFFMISAGMIFNNVYTEDNRANINVKIEKASDGTWRVRDAGTSRNMGTITANKSDKITFDVKGSNMVFSFPEGFNVRTYFDVPEGLFQDGRTQSMGNNSKLRLDVKADAPSLNVEYNVWVESERTLVIGNSPPVLIIR